MDVGLVRQLMLQVAGGDKARWIQGHALVDLQGPAHIGDGGPVPSSYD